ncbi:MAG: hypothetical protein ACTHK4_03970 [Mycobacteriales bacterium]
MTSAARRVAVIGSSLTLASAAVLGTAVAGTGGHGHGPKSSHGHTGKLVHTHLTVHAPATNGTRSNVVGTLRAHHTGVANETISVVQRSAADHTWTATGQTATTDADGHVTVALTQQPTTVQYRLVFAGDTAYRKSHSGTITIAAATPAPTSSPTATPTDTPTDTPTA